ncbi:LANO_0C07756g1_1 [Lachancea nothofagi CBS 11611]|uniref:LANO_0C07756g1_1 n=1 Tax=Lachancea nothofagi CBS 11611 TaxID=1266666 RepID=A0A1G4J943_9SACH|nr:LANO_0C07756g1_1 [Lachancea nothofagi CBS 11611]
MTSTRDQWFNNTTDLLNLDNSETADLDLGANININTMLGTGFDSKNFSNANLGIADPDLGKFFPSNYEDIDEFLTQELKDLDIPMIPQRVSSQPNSGDSASYDAVWNRPTDNNVETPRKSHNRGPSGTAIFGFTNHNKQLSVSKLTTEEMGVSNNNNINYLRPSRDNSNDIDQNYEAQGNNLNSLILKQQEELRLALERQQQMNAQLEQQLRSSQLQQQQLQMALKEQAMAAQHLSANVSPAKSPTSRTPQQSGRNIIITTNSANGGYKFPPPSASNPLHNGVISPVSGTSMNGSPSRKSLRTKGHQLHLNELATFTDSADDYSSPENYLGASNVRPKVSDSTIQNMSKYFEKVNNQASLNDRPVNNNPITPQQQIIICGASSTSSSPRINRHGPKESISSSASTIPQLNDDEDRHMCEPASSRTVGLGIKLTNEKIKPKYALNKPPSLEVLPTIPGSSDNTPLNKKFGVSTDSRSLPQKHVFQHTPSKNAVNPRDARNSVCAQSPSKPIFKTLKEELKPPTGHGNNYNDDDYDDDEPESEFKIAQTPSPILRSQGRFEGSSPRLGHDHIEDQSGGYEDGEDFHFDHENDFNNSSPLKITKKPTTLPPGEIDRYVQELSDKTFQCMYPTCGKTFRRRYNIRSHIQTHLEDRPYICDYEGCNKAFVRNHDLIRHKKIHAEKSFVCPCGKKFVREDALIVHRSRMICVGGKKFNNVVIKKSPRRRGRPRKDGTYSVTSSPVKESVARDNHGMIALQMEEQLRKELIDNGLLNPSSSMANMESPLENVRPGI